ncbi:MAG: DUF1538 domain-containing protein [Actinomycetota bacterium]
MKDFFALRSLLDIIIEVAIALIPLMVIFLIYQIFFLKLPRTEAKNIMKGMFLTFVGLVMFLYGVHIGFLPTGNTIGEVLGSLNHRWILIPIGFILGFTVTIAEPAVRVLCQEVENASSGYIQEKTMLFTISLGVAASIALAMARTLWGIHLAYFILPGYVVALALAKIISPTFTAIAFDSGGVATGPMTVTFIMAISVGAANIMEGRDAITDGFGLISLVALAPILSVVILGLLYRINERKQE